MLPEVYLANQRSVNMNCCAPIAPLPIRRLFKAKSIARCTEYEIYEVMLDLI